MGSSTMTEPEKGSEAIGDDELVHSSQTDTDPSRFTELLDQIGDQKLDHTNNSDPDTDSSRFDDLLDRIGEEELDHDDKNTNSDSIR